MRHALPGQKEHFLPSLKNWIENISHVHSETDLLEQVKIFLLTQFYVDDMTQSSFKYENGVWLVAPPSDEKDPENKKTPKVLHLSEYEQAGCAYLNHSEKMDGLSHWVFDDRDYVVVAFYSSGRSATLIMWKYQEWIQNFAIDDIRVTKEFLDTFGSMAAQVSLWLRKIKNVERQLYLDDLTGLYNFKFLDQTLSREIKRAERFEYAFSVLFVDLDDFKKVNDAYGHLNGSYILVQMGELFKNTLREIDSIYRYGGDEFVVLILGAKGPSAINVAERLRDAVAKNAFHTHEGNELKLTVSIGISVYPDHAKDKETLLDIADKNMYISKKRGKNRSFIRGHEDLILNL